MFTASVKTVVCYRRFDFLPCRALQLIISYSGFNIQEKKSFQRVHDIINNIVVNITLGFEWLLKNHGKKWTFATGA
jgi:hypothetical protein